MLILVAVTINMAVNGGLFNYAGKAVSETEISQEKEYITFAVSTIKMKKYANNDNTLIGEDELEEELKKYAEGVTVDGFNNLTITFASGRSYTISQDGDIELGDNIQTTGKWKQFAAGRNTLLGLGTDGNIYTSNTVVGGLMASNSEVLDIIPVSSSICFYIMENGKLYGIENGNVQCLNDAVEALKNEKIVSVNLSDGFIVIEEGKAFSLNNGTWLDDDIVALKDKKILNVGSYTLSDSETVTMVILDDQKAYYVDADGELVCFSDLYEELKGKKIVSSFLTSSNTVLIAEDGKAYQCSIDQITCINDQYEELKDKKIVKYDVATNGYILDNGELLYLNESSTLVSFNEEYEALQDKKIMGVDSLGLVWLEGGEHFYSIDNNTIINSGFEELLAGKNITQISRSLHHAVALDKNGKVWAWGDNNNGQLGDGTEDWKDIPTCISDIAENPLNGAKVVQVSAGYEHTVALDENGKVWAWGLNSSDQLGDGTNTSSAIPICISDIEGNSLNGVNIVQISAGEHFTVVLDSKGKVWFWGNLGDGSITPICISDIPEYLLNGTKIVQVSAGDEHIVMLDKNGKVWAWGDNNDGQLGVGTEDWKDIPTCISDIAENPLNGVNVVQVSAGYNYTVALDNNGKVWTWGNNSKGQLGDGTTTSSGIPICISDIDGNLLNNTTIIQVVAGYNCTILLDNNDDYYIFGNYTERYS